MKADRAERGERPPHGEAPAPSSDTRRRVLLIEDDADIAEARDVRHHALDPKARAE